jgi:hypothetical protein
MRKILILFFFILITGQTFSQVDKKPNDNSLTQINPVPFRLFPTQNMWTFIKLNTRTGQMWQVQFDVKENNRLVTTLSSEILVTKDKEANDRFTLYSTQNIYTFILLDQLDGRTWQVQWSTNPKQRVVIPIE